MAYMYPSFLLEGEVDKLSREDEVFEVLKKGLSNEYHVFHSRRTCKTINGKFYDSETDFIIFNRKKGLMVVEVKNSSFYYDGCRWVLENGSYMRYGGPWCQADREKSFLIEEMKEVLPRSIVEKCKVTFAVLLMNAKSIKCVKGEGIPSSFDSERTIFYDDLVNIQNVIDRIFSIPIKGTPVCTELGEEDEKTIIMKLLCPKCSIVFDGNSYQDALKRRSFKQLLEKQKLVLSFSEQQRFVAISGAAGTGKTMVAIEKAKRLGDQGEKVLFLCFNSKLASYLAKKCKCNNVTYKTIDGFVYSELYDNRSNNYRVERSLAYSKAKDTLENYILDEEHNGLPYDHIIIDEAQDFAIKEIQESGIIELLWLYIDSRNNEGCFYLFYDGYQMANGNQGKDVPSYIRDAETKLSLTINCRNTELIAKSSLTPIINVKYFNEELKKINNDSTQYNDTKVVKKKVRKKLQNITGATGGIKPSIIFLDLDDSYTIEKKVNDVISKYLKSGIKHEQITILSCEAADKSKFSRRLNNGNKWSESGVEFYTTSQFKGLENEVIILIEVINNTISSIWN